MLGERAFLRHFQWQDADGNPILGLHVGGLLRAAYSIEVADAFENDSTLPVLALLGIVVAKRAKVPMEGPAREPPERARSRLLRSG